MLPLPDDIFEHKYRIDRVLGKGAFSHVYRAVVDEIERVVAIKILKPQQSLDEMYSVQLEQRFLREARTLSELQDPHTIRMYDYGRSADGLLYMIFEYVDGASLNEIIHGDEEFGARRAAYITQQLLESMREAHLHGILHRDIKPANILVYEYLGDPNRVKLADFGIAKDIHDPDMQLTTKGMRVGTLRYMSPEQIRGGELTPASDIYSIGLVAYEMLAGEKAISSSDMSVISQFHLRDTPIKLPPRFALPTEFRAFVEKMVEKKPEARFASAGDALRALRAIDWDNVTIAYEDDHELESTLDAVPPIEID